MNTRPEPNIRSVLQKSKNAILYLARSNKAGVQPDGQNGALVSELGHDFMDILYIQDTLDTGIGILLACRGGETTLGLAHGFGLMADFDQFVTSGELANLADRVNRVGGNFQSGKGKDTFAEFGRVLGVHINADRPNMVDFADSVFNMDSGIPLSNFGRS